ncbi:MAG: type II secretion system F family protein [Candidatus Symbiodolus clandestinus]
MLFAFEPPKKSFSLAKTSLVKQALQQLDYRLAKMAFGSSIRLDFYQALLLLLDNQVRLNEALKELYRVYSHEGRKASAPVAIVINDCLTGMKEGIAFSERLSAWVPIEEGMLLQSGEAAGRLAAAFGETEKLIEAKKQIVSAVAGAVTYPIALIAMSGFLLNMVATELVPQLAQLVDPKSWTGSAAILNVLASFTTDYGLLTVGIVITLAVVIGFSLPRFNGPGRIWLDKLPPWSLYRMIQGATFLLNVSALIQSGMQLNMALAKLAVSTSPWLKVRINSTLKQLAAGKNFGEALCATGYHFPDAKANRFLSVIAEYSGLDIALAKFGRSWLTETVQGIQKISKLILIGGIMLVGSIMLLVIAGANGLQDSLQTLGE